MADYPEPPSPMAAIMRPPNQDTDRASRPSNSTESDDLQADLKRPRACEPCRQLKVRCDPDPDHPDGSCKRCAKARRTCIVTAPTRKRQRKTDSRVTELERKIDALTATLQKTHGGAIELSLQQQQQSPGLSRTSRREDHPDSRRWIPQDSHGMKRSHDEAVSRHYSTTSPPTEHVHRASTSKWRGPYAGETAPPKSPKADAKAKTADVIGKGLIDVQTANAAFQRYVNELVQEMPMVVFPPGTTMTDVRRQKPILLLAILAVAVGPFNKDLQPTLLSEAYQTIGDLVVVNGRKSLELVQALLVLTIWYMPPDNIEELKFYQLGHMAVILAMDIGLNRRAQAEAKPFVQIRDMLMKKSPGSAMDLNGPEARRTWVGCYFLTVQVSTALRRTHLVRWQPYMDECLRILETHPDALPSDRRIVWWAKLGLILEEAGTQLSTDDPESVMSFADSKVRHAAGVFAKRLAQWREDIPEDYYTMPLAHTHHVLNLFIHESAMVIDSKSSDTARFSSENDLTTSILAPHIDALHTCIHAIHQSLDAILSVNAERFTCLPTVSLARTPYPVVSLIKIYALLTTTDTRIGQFVDVQSLRLEYYLDSITNHYRTAAALDGGRAPAKFGNILAMLRKWFLKKRENGPALRELFGTDMRTDPSLREPMKPGATPLDLLSEVAAGNQPTRDLPQPPSRSRSGDEGYPNMRPSSNSRATPSIPGPSNLSNRESPFFFGRIPSTQSGQPPTTWSSASFPSTLPGLTNTNLSTGGFYPSYASPDASQGYTSMNSSAGAYPTSLDIPFTQPIDMTPEERESTFDPDYLFAMGAMMDEGLLTFPLGFDGSFQS